MRTAREHREGAERDADLHGDLRPQVEAAGPPEQRRGKRDGAVQPVADMRLRKSVNAGDEQRNCQRGEQAILEWIVQHRNPVSRSLVLAPMTYQKVTTGGRLELAK
jgi:hypothetical protein